MSNPRRPTLPRVLSRAAAAGALALVACENNNAVAQTSSSKQTDGQSAVQSEVSGDAKRGEKIYTAKCGACHSVDQNRIGPKHRGVYGRAAGGVEDYAYSTALATSGIVWNEPALDEWLAGPTKMVPGTRMGLALSDEQDRRDVIAYLNQYQNEIGAVPLFNFFKRTEEKEKSTMSIIDHLSVGVDDLAKAKSFYNPVLHSIGANLLAETEHFLAYGTEAVQFLAMPLMTKTLQALAMARIFALQAASQQEVRDFHKAALDAGGACEGEPGPRPAYPTDNAYAAYVRDPFGNKLEVITSGFSG